MISEKISSHKGYLRARNAASTRCLLSPKLTAARITEVNKEICFCIILADSYLFAVFRNGLSINFNMIWRVSYL